MYVDYDRYTNSDEMVSDNAGLMLLKLLKQCGADDVTLAGFDGFRHGRGGNYYSKDLIFEVNEAEAVEKQERIRQQVKELAETMRITFLTSSVYE